MISRRTQLILLGSVLTLAGPWACSSSPATSTGTGGTTSSSSTTLHTSSSSSGVVTVGTGGSQGGANLGLACTQDSDCGTPLKCILPSANDAIFGGGPANGYCSETCMTDNDCPSTGNCLIGTTGPGDCVLGCTLGPVATSLNEPLVPTKCQGRDDVACAAIDSEATVFGCLPNCGSDKQCPTGESCDPAAQVCVPTASVSTGAAMGTVCDTSTMPSTCAGICIAQSSTGTAGICSEPCVFGGNVATGPSCGGIAAGLCLFTPTGAGPGDQGACAAACTSQTACGFPTLGCFPITNLSGTSAGETNNGWCLPPTPCPNGATDCAKDLGPTCVQTSDGPFCLNTKYPAPGETDGGTGDAGSTTDAGTTTDAGADAGDGG